MTNGNCEVTEQGVHFGKAWYSHEKITGYSAEQLNSGNCRITGRAYMAWVQSILNAPRADAEKDAALTAVITTCNEFLVKQGTDFELGAEHCARKILRAILVDRKEK